MSTTNPTQLFLLADHVKLSLLERQRAIALNLEPHKQDGHITRSLETLRDGLENLQKQVRQLASSGDDTTDLKHQISRLSKQYAELAVQFHGSTAAVSSPILTTPNDPALAADFDHAKQPPSSRLNKSVRFRDDPFADQSAYHDDDDDDDDNDEDARNRSALFSANGTPSASRTQSQARYRDDPDQAPDQSHLSNQQIHTFHKQVLQEQDDQLDTLGQSIRRQRTLGLQMGEELDEHVEMLDDIEAGVDRHQGTLDRASKRLSTVARKAKDNWSWITIACLILLLILLIALT